LLVGFGFLSISIIWPIFNQYIPIFLQAGNPEFAHQLLAEGREIPKVVGFGLAPSLALFIMTWDNIINIFVQPWVGERSDRTWNRFGRRKGWILLGLPIAVLGPTLGGVMVQVLGNQYRWIWLFSMVFMALAWLAMTQVKEVRLLGAKPAVAVN